MIMPSEFKKLTRGFHQGVGDMVTSLDELIDVALSFLEPVEYGTVRKYLAEILAPPVDKQNLKKVWDQSSADLNFDKEDDLVKVLQLLDMRLSSLESSRP